MAGGWASDGAVNDQIEASTREALARMRLRHRAGGESLADCADCGEPIPQARRRAQPGVRLCVACQTQADRVMRPAGGMNRRASKDSLLK